MLESIQPCLAAQSAAGICLDRRPAVPALRSTKKENSSVTTKSVNRRCVFTLGGRNSRKTCSLNLCALPLQFETAMKLRVVKEELQEKDDRHVCGGQGCPTFLEVVADMDLIGNQTVNCGIAQIDGWSLLYSRIRQKHF